MKAATLVCGFLFILAVARGQTNLTAWTADAGCARSETAGRVLYHAAAQGQPVSVRQAGETLLFEGFLGGAVLMPDLDTDGDGVNNETDGDNDNDGLTDGAEISGQSFVPPTSTEVNEADSDGDGSSDRDESIAQTNPRDPSSYLHITEINVNGGFVEVRWQARAGLLYTLKAATNLLVAIPLASVAVVNAPTGGIPPWHEVEAQASVSKPLASPSYYRIQCVTP